MDVKEMSVKEFREKGYLQEVNRKFFHPLGLALEVVLNKDGSESLGKIWDDREDNMGMVFSEVDKEKIRFVSKEFTKREVKRISVLGQTFQPSGKLNIRNKKGVDLGSAVNKDGNIKSEGR